MEKHEQLHKGQIFKGEVVLFYLMNAPEEFSGGIVIANPSIQDICGRIFVVGTVPNIDDWSVGANVGVALDQVAHYLEFSSEQEFNEKSAFWNQSTESLS